MKKYTWNFGRDAELWNRGTYDTIEECFVEARRGIKACGINGNGINRVFIGEVVPFIPQVDAIDVLDAVKEQAEYFTDDVDNDWEAYDYQKRGELEELSNALSEAVNGWLKKYGYTPSFYEVQNIKEYQL